ncbi:dienelactone hydrolase [Shewanella vesiculosa]|uniref:alpha/beta fold hydrolase n=1 Tax=Shewanella vesiculosa TaxID=518738 RepID=UPI000F4D6A0B|nr:dienelactone hydrolase [Shewanella vesiculosa]
MNCLPDNTRMLAHDSLLQGPKSDTLIVFAHGAGANMHHEYMATMTDKLIAQGYQVYRFNFLYMQANMQDGKRRPPDRAPKLLAHYEQVLQDIKQKIALGQINCQRIILVGKSMGGRMSATLTSTDYQRQQPGLDDVMSKVAAIVCLGYPFIPLKGGKPRLDPIVHNALPMLIVQGERDKFGDVQQVPTWTLGEHTQVCWIGDGDHSLQPRKSSGFTLEGNLNQAIEYIRQFISQLG